MAKQYDVLFRLLLLGDSGVGKTCMLRRFTEGEFDPSHISTIGKLQALNCFAVTLSQVITVINSASQTPGCVYSTELTRLISEIEIRNLYLYDI